jgi:UDP-N-acetyl-D-glucosamine/UDP-N-acetyl-D-galactosamine dehydrogenase
LEFTEFLYFVLFPIGYFFQVNIQNFKIAIVGLGYVGLPLAIEFGKKTKVIGFDLLQTRIDELKSYIDSTMESSLEEIKEAKHLIFTNKLDDIKDCNVYIITVPTPINVEKKPDLFPLVNATTMVGEKINKGDVIIFESTVFPGATEEVCVPILEEKSNLKFNVDFFCGYSPERINPGDKSHRLTNIKKIVSGSDSNTASLVDSLYSEIIEAGTHKTESIKIAEAAKVIENTQRDLNIALINELALIFNRLDIDTEAVLEAAKTKWNFLPFTPGLVGGHCIGVDPYYLTYKAEQTGYIPEIILTGRKLNDSMGLFIASEVKKLMRQKLIVLKNSNILIMGFTFKENCPDTRNTRVIDLINDFKASNCNVDVYDPWVNPIEANKEYSVELVKKPISAKYDAIVITVAHDIFKEMTFKQINKLGNQNHVLYDVKYLLRPSESDGRL